MVIVALLHLAALSYGPGISVSSLLPEMTDMSHLTHRPSPAYTMAQSSSYDRRSNPGPNSNPFANGDAGNFLRVEKTANGNEYVMADLKGPGAVVRVWSANPAGTIRFYFDGESTPRLQASMADLLQGKVKPFIDPFAYNAANGTNLYFPFPYAKSLKITADETGGDGVKSLYYHVGYRTYGSGTQVETYAAERSVRELAEMSRQRFGLLYPAAPGNSAREYKSDRTTLKAGSSWKRVVAGGGTIKQLQIRIPFPLVETFRAMDWSDPNQPHNILRTVLMSISVDGHPVVATPLGDFFGTAPGLNVSRTLPFEVRADGTMICRLPMPFKSRFELTLRNVGKVDVPFMDALYVDESAPKPGAYALHAEWSVDKGSTRPMRDMHFLNTTGEGLWVGSNMHVSNPAPGWWGEGDEKAYVDGESFPSTFGTGTEDYYGYAWSAPIVFMRPYHAQPRSDGPGNFGHSSVQRWQILDPIPFTRSFKFDLEMWHWQEVDANYTHTAYWYAPADQHPPKAIDESLLLPMELAPPKPVKGAIEGESMKILAISGGNTEEQSGFWELSSGKQLWWKEASKGDKLTLALQVPQDGTYDIVGNFCHAQDYGIHQIALDGKVLGQWDFYGKGVTWKKLDLGSRTLTAGEHRLEVVCQGKGDAAAPGQMFGLDYLLLQKQ